MAADPRYPPPLADTWTPLIDTDALVRPRAALARRGARAGRCSAGTAATIR